VSAEDLEALLHPVEELLVPPKCRLHGRLHHGGIGDHCPKVDEGPRKARHPQGPEPSGVRGRQQLAAVQRDALRHVGIAAPGGRQLDHAVRLDAVQFPEGGGRSVGHRSLGPGPEGGCHQPLFPRGRGTAHSVDAGMQPLPLAGIKTVLDRAPSKTGLERLRTAEDASLLGDETAELSFFVW